MPPYPKSLILSLQPAARILLSLDPLNLPDRAVILGTSVECNDTPWPAMADLLIDSATREFVGMTFGVAWAEDPEIVRRLSKRLDPRVVRYNDMSTSELREPYDGSAGDEHWFEIVWKPTRHLKMELAQLMNGQYWWWYATRWNGEEPRPVVAISLDHLDETSSDHGIIFPSQIDLPPLDANLESH